MKPSLAFGMGLVLLLCVIPVDVAAGQLIDWPDTPAANVFRGFLTAYNSGSVEQMRSFVRAHYNSNDAGKIAARTEYWMDIFSRYGSVRPHSISINEELDIEVWVQGEISKTWFAPEFVLAEGSGKVRATGMLLGMRPPGVDSPAANEAEFVSRIRKYLETNEQAGLFQGSVLVQKGTDIVFHEAYGLKNIARKEKNRPDTRMRLSSVTKIITAVACLQLVQDGKLDLHEPVSSYLPDLPSHIADKVTIAHLLTHTSGYELDGIDGFRDDLEKTQTMAQVYQLHLSYLPKWESHDAFETSSRFDYSNDSYDLLAIIIEKITGLRFEVYLQERVFDVARMPNTGFGNDGLAAPYRYDISANGLTDQKSHYPHSLGNISGAGVLKSTVHDLRNLSNALLNSNQLLDLPHRGLLLGPRVTRGGDDFHSYGLHISYDPVTSIGHAGTNIGNTAELRYFPESGYLLVVLSNNRSGAPNLHGFFKSNLPRAPES